MIYLLIAGIAGLLLYKNRVATTPQQAALTSTQQFSGAAAVPVAGPRIGAVQAQIEPAVVARLTAGAPVVAPTFTPPEFVQLGPILREPAIVRAATSTEPSVPIGTALQPQEVNTVSAKYIVGTGLGGSYGALL